jgi:hypothetical protein
MDDEELRATLDGAPPWLIEQKLAERRAERHDALSSRFGGERFEMEQRRNRIAGGVPGLGNPNAAREIAALQAEYSKSLPDPTVLSRTARAGLLRQGLDATNPAHVLSILREVEFRAESDEQAKVDIAELERHLDDIVLAMPDVQRAAAMYRQLGDDLDCVNETLRAVKDADDDAGELWDLMPAMRAAQEQGIGYATQITRGPDGRPGFRRLGAPADPAPAGEKWIDNG